MERKVLFSWHEFFEAWKMAYRKGYEDGYMDKSKGNSFRPEAYSHPPDVLMKIFESVSEQEEE